MEEEKKGINNDLIDAAFDVGPSEEEIKAKKDAEELENKKKRLFKELGRLSGGRPAKLLNAFKIAIEKKEVLSRMDEFGNRITEEARMEQEEKELRKKLHDAENHDFHPKDKKYKRLKNPHQQCSEGVKELTKE